VTDFEVEDMRAYLRLIQDGRIAFEADAKLAEISYVLRPGGIREAAQFKQFRKADQRLSIWRPREVTIWKCPGGL
jgi:hypothetical protein